MEATRAHTKHRVIRGVALISLPWNLANRPSLALGALKGYLLAHDVPIDAHHLHLAIAYKLGAGRYHQIAMDWELGESLYSALVAPDERARIIGRARRQLEDGTRHETARWITEAFCDELAKATRESVTTIDFSRYKIVGFSVSHLQLMASLYVAQMLKQLAPEIAIVFGGRGVAGEAGRNVLAHCPEVDVVVDGEGEEALLQLSRLSLPLDKRALDLIPNLWFRGEDGELRKTKRRTLSSLEDTATPDFSEYFDLAGRLSYPPSDLVLPLEASRGCAWEHRRTGGPPWGCAFCGLNSNWPNYREKPLGRVLKEIEHNTKEYRVLDLSFADACLPDSYRKALLQALAASPKDLTLFCEMRPGFDEETARLLANANVRRIQIGVESFSTHLLTRFGKGVRAIDNVQCLKLCEEYRIPYQYNLLIDVPGVEERAIEETCVVLPLLYGLRPPNLVPLFLDRGSRMCRTPEAFDIASEDLGERACGYLPSRLAEAGVSDFMSYHGASQIDAGWEKVVRLVDEWREVHTGSSSRLGLTTPFFYRDGGDFVTIADFRGQEASWITLEGAARELFLACSRMTTMEELQRKFSNVCAGEIRALLDRFSEEGLILREGAHLLALPIRAPAPNGMPGNALC
jgi:ribosomal peptide maturation radical SAM protein 1